MGGMTVIALAERHPGLFGTKVIGAALISTAPGESTPRPGCRAAARRRSGWRCRRCCRGLQRAAGRAAARSRESASDIAFLATGASPSAICTSARPWWTSWSGLSGRRRWRSCPLSTWRWPITTSAAHWRSSGRVPSVVLTGDRDRLVALRLSEELAEAIPGAEFIQVPRAGHVLILERPELVNDVIIALVAHGADSRPGATPPRRRAAQPCPADSTRPTAPSCDEQVQVPATGELQMRDLGARLAALLRPGDLIVLSGPLGAGKTTLAQGIGAGPRRAGPGHLAHLRDRAGAPVAGRWP